MQSLKRSRIGSIAIVIILTLSILPIFSPGVVAVNIFTDSFEVDFGNWNIDTGNCTRSNTRAHSGTWSLKLAAVTGDEVVIYSDDLALLSGGYDTCTLDFWWYYDRGNNDGSMYVDFYDGTASYRQQTTSLTSLNDDTWYQTTLSVYNNTYTFSDTAAWYIQFNNNGVLIPSYLYLDQIYINQSSSFIIGTLPVTNITKENATLNAVMNTQGQTGDYGFVYGDEEGPPWDHNVTVGTGSTGTWYDMNFLALKVITVTNPVANYQMRLNVTYDGDMQADFDDLRFVDDDNVTALPYWIEYKVNSAYALIWVKLHDTGTKINMYYQNPTVSTTSSGTNTWNYFLDWSVDHSADFTERKSGAYGIRYDDLPQIFTTAAGFRMLYKQWDDAHTINQYDTGCNVGVLDDAVETFGETTESIRTYNRLDSDGTPDQAHYIVTENDNTATQVGTYDYVATIDNVEVWDVKCNSTVVNLSIRDEKSDGTLLKGEQSTTNIPNGNLDVIGYGADFGDSAGTTLYWTWIDANDAIEYGSTAGSRCVLKVRQTWLAMGMYQSTEPTGSFGVSVNAPVLNFTYDATGLNSTYKYYFQAWFESYESSIGNFWTLPDAPTNFSAILHTLSITFNWVEPDTNDPANLRTVLRYDIDSYPVDETDGTQWCNTTSNTSSGTLPFNAGHPWYFAAFTYFAGEYSEGINLTVNTTGATYNFELRYEDAKKKYGYIDFNDIGAIGEYEFTIHYTDGSTEVNYLDISKYINFNFSDWFNGEDNFTDTGFIPTLNASLESCWMLGGSYISKMEWYRESSDCWELPGHDECTDDILCGGSGDCTWCGGDGWQNIFGTNYGCSFCDSSGNGLAQGAGGVAGDGKCSDCHGDGEFCTWIPGGKIICLHDNIYVDVTVEIKDAGDYILSCTGIGVPLTPDPLAVSYSWGVGSHTVRFSGAWANSYLGISAYLLGIGSTLNVDLLKSVPGPLDDNGEETWSAPNRIYLPEIPALQTLWDNWYADTATVNCSNIVPWWENWQQNFTDTLTTWGITLPEWPVIPEGNLCSDAVIGWTSKESNLVDTDLTDGRWYVNSSKNIDWVELRHSTSETFLGIDFGTTNYSDRKTVFQGQPTIFYSRLDLLYYPFLTAVTGIGFAQYHISFTNAKNTRGFANVYITDKDANKRIIHSEYLDTNNRIHPLLIVHSTYSLELIYEDGTTIDCGEFIAGTNEELSVNAQGVTADSGIYQYCDITPAWTAGGFQVTVTDKTSTALTLYFYVYNESGGVVDTQTFIGSSKVFTFACNTSLNWWFKVDDRNIYGYFSTGKRAMTASITTPTISGSYINTLFLLMFGPSPLTMGGAHVDWAYILVLILALIGLLGFAIPGKGKAYVGLFVEGFVFIGSAAVMNDVIGTLGLGAAGLFLMLLGIFAALGAKKEAKEESE